MSNARQAVTDELVMSRILVIRGLKVMLDIDLAELYGVPTKRLNEQVRRNLKRFPEDFMFQLTAEEKAWVVANCDHLERLKFSPNLPLAFTEHGAVMLASVLNSQRAIDVNIRIVRIFNRMRELVLTHKDILLKLDRLERETGRNSADLQLVFKTLKQMLDKPSPPRKRIGYKKDPEE